MHSLKVIVFSLDQKLSRILQTRLLSFGSEIFISKNIFNFFSDISDFQPDVIFIDESSFLNNISSLKQKINKFFLLYNLPIVFIAKDFFFLDTFCSSQSSYFIKKPFSIAQFDEKIAFILKTNYFSLIQTKPYSQAYFYLKNKSFNINMLDIQLTKLEFLILSLQLSQSNEVCAKSFFLKNIWRSDFLDDNTLWFFKFNSLEMIFLTLRKKMTFIFKSSRFLRKKNYIYFFHF